METEPSPTISGKGQGGMRRYAGISLALWRNSIVREMTFKANFVLWIVVEMMWFSLQLGFIAVLYLHTDSIATWTKWQVVFLMGTSHFIQQIFGGFFLNNITQLSELIRTGRLDFMLLLPINTRFLVSFRHVDLGGFVNAGTAVAVMMYALFKLEHVPSATEVLVFGFLCLFGVLIHYSLMLSLSCISFWTVRSEGIVWGYYNLFNIARLPDEAFKGPFKAVFTFVIPMLLVANVPARLMIDKMSDIKPILALVGMALLCWFVSLVTWKRSVRHYTSASS